MFTMHIAFLTSEYPHASLSKSAGLGTSIKNLATELFKKGVKISIFIYSQDKDAVIDDEGITLYKIAHKKYPFFGWYLYRKHIEKVINSSITENKIDLIEAPDWTGITAFMRFKCPLVIRLHGSDGYFCNLENRKQKFKNFFFEKSALKSANKIISVSAFTAQKTKRIFSLRSNIEIIPNGINIEKFKPKVEEIIKGQILYFGTIIRKKGVLELAQAFNLLVKDKSEVSLTLLGKDVIDIFEKKSTLTLFFSHLSDRAKSKVTHLDEVPYNEVSEIIAKAHLVTLPSFAEALPMTWLETMAMEKPFISSNIGWANEMMINNETGFTLNPKNHADYANKMKRLLEDNDLANKFGMQARTVVLEKFEAKRIADINMAFYNKMLTINK